MKKFFKDFKAFISRGNILDMAVGVIIGSAFSAIVTALTNKIIMPLINALLAGAGGGLDSAYTILRPAYVIENGVTTDVLDLANSIYIDWGAFITAVINFLLIALVLFIMLKVAMKSSSLFKETRKKISDNTLNHAERKELKAHGINIKDKEAVKQYFADKQAEEERAKAEEEAKAQAEAEEKMKNSTEYLLKEIRDLLLENAELKKNQKSEQ